MAAEFEIADGEEGESKAVENPLIRQLEQLGYTE